MHLVLPVAKPTLIHSKQSVVFHMVDITSRRLRWEQKTIALKWNTFRLCIGFQEQIKWNKWSTSYYYFLQSHIPIRRNGCSDIRYFIDNLPVQHTKSQRAKEKLMGATTAVMGSDLVALLSVKHPWVQGIQIAEGSKHRTWLKNSFPRKSTEMSLKQRRRTEEYIHTSLCSAGKYC